MPAGIDRTAYSKAVVAAGYDNDGYVDFCVSNLNGDNFLYHNNHDGTFSEAAASPSEEAVYVIANSYAGQGDAQMKLAEKERQSGRKLPLLQKACGLFDQSLKAWRAIREPGTMSPNGFYSVAPAAVAARLKSCRSAVQEF